MSRRVKEFVDIKDHNSLDELIGKLIEVRDQLPENCEAELKLRGDDVFGHRLTITYLRELTAEEAEIERRAAGGCPSRAPRPARVRRSSSKATSTTRPSSRRRRSSSTTGRRSPS